VRAIATSTARYFSLRLNDLRSASRRRPVVVARGVAMFLCRLLARESLDRIGQYFGGRDHTTVMHACRKTEELLQTDLEIRQAIDKLRQKLETS
jgi:chromosomal replication initiator protein